MLSRIAESLYWLGRHVERADCTARILDTYLHLLPAGSWQADHQVIRSLLDSMGLSDDDTVGAGSQADSGQLVRALVFDGERASSVAGALTAARENARGVRDAIPLDVWECLNVTWHGLRTRDGTRRRPARLPALGRRALRHRERPGQRGDEPRRGLALPGRRAVAGARRHDHPAARRRRVRDRIGAAVARAGQRLRRLGAVRPAPTAAPSGSARAIEFVLLDRQFPRSVLRSLTAAETLPGRAGGGGRHPVHGPAP